METKTETKTRNSFKKFICDNINTIVVSSLTLAGGCAVGMLSGIRKVSDWGKEKYSLRLYQKVAEMDLL